MDQKAAGPDPELVNSVLSARDARWEKRLALAEEAPSLVSLTLCVPLPLRTSPEGKALLRAAAEKLEEKLKLAGFQPAEAEYMDGADGLAAFIPCRADAEALKRCCVKEEESLPEGRLLDMDVTERGGRPVGRAELGMPPRCCFLCGRPAAECVSARRHEPAAVEAYVRGLLAKGEEI